MARPAQTLEPIVESLLRPAALAELAALAAALAAAWIVVRLVRGRVSPSQPPPQSVWFGRRIVDGVLFPVLALAFAWVAAHVLAAFGPLAVLKLALPILVSLVAIRTTARVLSAAFPASRAMRVAERTVSWLAWIGVALWVTGLLPDLLDELDRVQWKFGATHVSVRSLIEAVFNAAVVLVIALWLSAALEAKLLRGAMGGNLSLRKIAANAVRALLVFVGLLLALSAAGIDLTALSVLGGAIGVGIGLGLQKLAANYVSGFVILAEGALRIGDMVRVDNFEGRITDISTRYTVIRSLGGREALVPNEMLITQRVESFTLADPLVAVATPLQVAYGTDLDRLFPALLETVRSVPRVLAEPGPAVQLAGFGADGLDLKIVFWIRDPEGGEGGVKSDVNLAVLRCLDRLGVEIPFPQRVLRRAPPSAAG